MDQLVPINVPKKRLPTMFLVVCATEFELQSLLDQGIPESSEWITLVTGVGPVETALSLTRFLERRKNSGEEQVHTVLNFGVGGAYLDGGSANTEILELCLAEKEVFGDFGICYSDRMESLAEHLVHRSHYTLDNDLLKRAEKLLNMAHLSVRCGNFVTVCGVTASARRGAMLMQQHNALCENMEGGAVARVCEAYNLPLLEMRAISNYVEERDLSRWKLQEACDLAGKAVAILLQGLMSK